MNSTLSLVALPSCRKEWVCDNPLDMQTFPGHPWWSPDGKAFAVHGWGYREDEESRNFVKIWDFSGAHPRPEPPIPDAYFEAVLADGWTHDGRHMLYLADHGPRSGKEKPTRRFSLRVWDRQQHSGREVIPEPVVRLTVLRAGDDTFTILATDEKATSIIRYAPATAERSTLMPAVEGSVPCLVGFARGERSVLVADLVRTEAGVLELRSVRLLPASGSGPGVIVLGR